MPPSLPSTPSPALAPSLSAPAFRGCPLSPTPRETDDLGNAVAWTAFAPHPRESCSKCIPQEGCPRNGALLWHLPIILGALGPPSPRAPSLRCKEDAASVPLAQAAAPGRWPWQSWCHPCPGEDAEWHQLCRGMASSISITPPWAGTTAGAPTAPRHSPCRCWGRDQRGGTKEGRGIRRAQPSPASGKLSRCQGPAKHH